jgi:hypothetical protein
MKKFKVTETIYYMNRTKTYTHEGTLEDLIKYSKYTFEIGQSYNPKINTNPKTIKGYISNLKKSLEEKHCCPVEVSYIEI